MTVLLTYLVGIQFNCVNRFNKKVVIGVTKLIVKLSVKPQPKKKMQIEEKKIIVVEEKVNAIGWIEHESYSLFFFMSYVGCNYETFYAWIGNSMQNPIIVGTVCY